MSAETITYGRDVDGVVTLTLDDPTQPVNTMRPQPESTDVSGRG